MTSTASSRVLRELSLAQLAVKPHALSLQVSQLDSQPSRTSFLKTRLQELNFQLTATGKQSQTCLALMRASRDSHAPSPVVAHTQSMAMVLLVRYRATQKTKSPFVGASASSTLLPRQVVRLSALCLPLHQVTQQSLTTLKFPTSLKQCTGLEQVTILPSLTTE